jgi:hypothetical protein
MIISIDTENALDKIQHPKKSTSFHVKNSEQIICRKYVPQHNQGYI